MPRGGARVRSGPKSDPNSGRTEQKRRQLAAAKKTASSTKSDAAGSITNVEFNPMALPARGRTANPPAFPLPKIVRFVMVAGSDGKPKRHVDTATSTQFRTRELEIWRQIWKSPQAVAWEREPYRWPTIGEFCRLKAVLEADPDSNAALFSRLREYRNEIGLSPDGLRQNGWAIAPDQLAAKRADKAAAPAKKTAAAPVRRLRK